MKFVELKMVDTRKNKPIAKMAPPFLEWQVGYTVRSKLSGQKWVITDIDTGAMKYESTVTVRSRDGDETRTFRGATLQTGYAYDSGDASKPEAGPWLPISINPEAVRNFYPRKNGQPGTRILMTDGTAYVVANEYEEVAGRLS